MTATPFLVKAKPGFAPHGQGLDSSFTIFGEDDRVEMTSAKPAESLPALRDRIRLHLSEGDLRQRRAPRIDIVARMSAIRALIAA